MTNAQASQSHGFNLNESGFSRMDCPPGSAFRRMGRARSATSTVSCENTHVCWRQTIEHYKRKKNSEDSGGVSHHEFRRRDWGLRKTASTRRASTACCSLRRTKQRAARRRWGLLLTTRKTGRWKQQGKRRSNGERAQEADGALRDGPWLGRAELLRSREKE